MVFYYKKLGYTCCRGNNGRFHSKQYYRRICTFGSNKKIELISPINRNSTIFNFHDGYHDIC